MAKVVAARSGWIAGPHVGLSVHAIAARHLDQVKRLMAGLDLAAVERVVQMLAEAQARDAAVFIIGNGGSAATASHFAIDLLNAARRSGGLPFRVFSLTDNNAILTGISNDEGYESVFAAPVESSVRPGDLVLGISASGNSPNVLRAIESARERGAQTIALVGFDGGSLGRMADESILVASPMGAYGPVEDVHLMLEHVISACLAEVWAGDGCADGMVACAVS